MRVTFRIDGEQETIKNISMFDMEKKQGAQAIVRKYANAVRRTAKRAVPVSPANRKKSSGQPGDLKSSIKNQYYFNGLGAMVMPARPKGSHRAIVEYGTKERRQKKTGRRTGKVSPQPFMTPAKASQEASYNNEMKRLFEGDQTEV